MNCEERRLIVAQTVVARGLNGMLVTSETNRRYLSGFTGSTGWLFIGADGAGFVTDGRYWAQVEQQCPGVELVKYRSNQDRRLSVCLANWLKERGWSGKLGFEGCSLSCEDYQSLVGDLVSEDGPVTEMVSVGSSLDYLRIIKSDDEIAAIRKAASVADMAWSQALSCFRAGVTEADFCAELEYRMQKCGARKPSFDTIVASGNNGAYPHAGVTDRIIEPGEMVTVDFGALVDGYCSDITRTIWLGQLDNQSEKIWQTVRTAHDEALAQVKSGVAASKLDKIARDIITEAGFGEAFSHSLGHGVGLAVHEAPGLRAESQDILYSGMLVTIEPGIYIPGVGGCRIEDLVVVTDDGCEVLSRSPYQELTQTHPLAAFY